MIPYTLTDKAVGRERLSRAWVYADVRNLTGIELFSLYQHLSIGLIDDYGNDYVLNVYDYEGVLRDYPDTLSTWLLTLGEGSLTLTAGTPSLTTTTVPYFPFWHKPSTAQLAKRGWHPSHYTVTDDADDVIVNIQGVDGKYLHDNVLWSINGYFTSTNYHTYGCRLHNAGDIIRKSGKMAIGGLNFENVGKVSIQPLTINHVFKVDEAKRYFDGVHLLLDEPLGNRTVGLVLGGYLHLLDGLVKPISETMLRFTPGDLNIVERVLLSKDYLDLSFMQLDDINKGATVASITQDSNWLSYLTSEYSFLVFIDNVNVWRTYTYVDTVSRPGAYLQDDTENCGMLLDRYGRMINYWPKYECNQIALCSDDYLQPTHAFNDTDWLAQLRINDAGLGEVPYNRINPKMIHYHAKV